MDEKLIVLGLFVLLVIGLVFLLGFLIALIFSTKSTTFMITSFLLGTSLTGGPGYVLWQEEKLPFINN